MLLDLFSVVRTFLYQVLHLEIWETVLSDELSNSDESEDTEIDLLFKDESKPLFINQERLNDLVRDLYLSKEKAETLGSRLQQWYLLQEGTTISSFRQRNQNLSYYAIANDICYCTNVDGLTNDLGYEYNSAAWRLIIDSSKTSLKAVLLHNGNSKLFIPVGHRTLRKEAYSTIKVLLEQLNYLKYTWKICSDIKLYLFSCDCCWGISSICASYAFGIVVMTVVITLLRFGLP